LPADFFPLDGLNFAITEALLGKRFQGIEVRKGAATGFKSTEFALQF